MNARRGLAADISQKLTSQIVDLVYTLLPAGKREGHEVAGRQHRGRGRAFARRAPDRAEGRGLVPTSAPGSPAMRSTSWPPSAIAVPTEAMEWAAGSARQIEDRAGKPSRRRTPVPPQTTMQTGARPRHLARGAGQHRRHARRSVSARAGLRSRPPCQPVGASGQWPATLRYSERAALDPGRLCRALIVAVHGADCGLVRAVQRILLHPDGTAQRGRDGKKIKLSLGPIAGNAAMFDYEPDPAGRWGIAEGCETALAASR